MADTNNPLAQAIEDAVAKHPPQNETKKLKRRKKLKGRKKKERMIRIKRRKRQ
jgi:hypothetical protein